MQVHDSADDMYNDGATYAMWQLGHDSTVPSGAVSFTDGSNTIFTMTVTEGMSWGEFGNEANKQINLDLGNLVDDGDGNVSLAEGKTAYAYVEMFSDGIKLNFAHGLEAPSGLTGYFIDDDDLESDDPSYLQTVFPTGAPSVNFTENGTQVSYAANMYAPSMEFIEGTGDDDDVFLAFGLSPRDVVAESDYGSSGSYYSDSYMYEGSDSYSYSDSYIF